MPFCVRCGDVGRAPAVVMLELVGEELEVEDMAFKGGSCGAVGCCW